MGNNASNEAAEDMQDDMSSLSASRRSDLRNYTQPLSDGSDRVSPTRRRHKYMTPTGTPSGSERSSDSMTIPSLQKSLMRIHKHRDPLKYYEVIQVLGDGSMGSVSKVRKRESAVGGSARREFVNQSKAEKCGFFGDCFLLFCPPRSSQSDSSSRTRSSLLDPVDEDSNPASNENSNSNRHVSFAESKQGRQKSYHRKASASSMISYDRKEATYALKSIILSRCKDSTFRLELMNEVAILQRLDHRNIVKAIETFDYHNRLYLVLELCSGGDLYSRDPYDEMQACRIVRSVMRAVAYMHNRTVTHRDLKFENIMFANPNSNSVKIIDFGLSKKYGDSATMTDTVGTVYTMAPEVLKGEYDEKCDLWSIGVIAFMLLSSSLPFYGKNRQHVVRKILQHKYAFKGARWKKITPQAKEFIMELLHSNPKRRPTAEEALKNAWLYRDMQDVDERVSFALMDRVQASIVAFSTYGMLKKLALLVVAYKSTDDEIGFLRKTFREFDVLKDGEISLREFKQALAVYKYEEEEMERMFVAMDLDGTGKVHYSEFLAATMEAHGFIEEHRIAEAFDRLDSDDSGYITVKNLLDFLGNEISTDFAASIIDEADLTRDKRISYDEFLALWNEDSDLRHREALSSVNLRRETFDESDEISVGETLSVDETDFSAATSIDSSELGGGGYFFDVEKEKSMRGEWV